MSKRTRRIIAAVATSAASCLLFGCAGTVRDTPDAKTKSAVDLFLAGKPSQLQPIYRALYVEGEHNAVLNLDYLGLAAMEMGDYLTAEKAFDAAIARIDAVYADNPEAKKARSVFAEEKVKPFKGEPYERAMTFYYRGILYARAGDYENARASFRSAELQSTLSERESYKSNFGLMDYLAAWASNCNGEPGKAQDFLARAAEAETSIFAGHSANSTRLGLIDVGVGPAKVGVGEYKEKLAFKPSGVEWKVTDVVFESGAGEVIKAGDLDYQATHRGGRQIDAVLNGKAQVKGATDKTGNALVAGGYAATLVGGMNNNSGMQAAGLVGMFAGLAAKGIASAMTPAADTRAWSTLPSGLLVVESATPAPTSQSANNLRFMSALGAGAAGASQVAQLNAQTGRCSISWARDHSSLELASNRLARPVADGNASNAAVDQQFRAILESTFAGPVAVAEMPAAGKSQ